jgi:endonuclease/exonuclease/phosphatase (EEP) superfamily protein YafD
MRHEPQPLLRLISEYDPDVIAIAEIAAAGLLVLNPVRDEYETVAAEPREDGFGIALFSRLEVQAGGIGSTGSYHLPTAVGILKTDSTAIAVHALHMLPPVPGRHARERNAHMEWLADLVRQTDPPVIAIGDLNCTPYSPHFRSLLGQSGLRDARRGFGIKPTWPAALGPLGLPIDHCLVSDGIGVTGFTIGPDIGSDHRPIIVDLVIP